MTIQNLIEQAKAHNTEVDNFVNVTLRKRFGGDKISINQWFEAQNLISAQNFYGKGIVIVDALRANGVDAKLNMQTNKICIPYKYC